MDWLREAALVVIRCPKLQPTVPSAGRASRQGSGEASAAEGKTLDVTGLKMSGFDDLPT